MDANFYNEYSMYLTNKMYPKRINNKIRKNNWRKRCKNFYLKEGTVLYFKHKYHGDLEVVRQQDMERIITEQHIMQNGLHLGINKTRQRISKKYFYRKIAESVTEYIQRCSTCNVDKQNMNPPRMPVAITNQSCQDHHESRPLKHMTGNAFMAGCCDDHHFKPEITNAKVTVF